MLWPSFAAVAAAAAPVAAPPAVALAGAALAGSWGPGSALAGAAMAGSVRARGVRRKISAAAWWKPPGSPAAVMLALISSISAIQRQPLAVADRADPSDRLG